MDCFIFPPPGEKSHAEWKRHHSGQHLYRPFRSVRGGGRKRRSRPRPPPRSYFCLSQAVRFSDLLRVLVLPAGYAWRRARLTVCTLRTVFAEYRRFPAVGFAVRFTKRGRRPAEKLRTKEIRDNCPNITNFLCQQTYITISTKYTGNNQPLKSLSLHL